VSGEYNLKVRVKYNEKNYDNILKINILEGEVFVDDGIDTIDERDQVQVHR